MKKFLAIMLLLAAGGTARAAEMFETYEKKWALGYVVDQVNARYWFNPAWGLDAAVGFSDQTNRATADDGVTYSSDRAESDGHSFGLAALRNLKTFPYIDLNLKAGVTYARSDNHEDPDGPSNSATAKVTETSVFVGPEVEIKLPYFSRLVIVSSVQLAYRRSKTSQRAETVGGAAVNTEKATSLAVRGDDNSLHELMHVGVRYYF